jgi:hypothetical protein
VRPREGDRIVPDNSPLKKDSPALRIRIHQPHSAEYLQFLAMMPKAPERKDRCAEMWYQDRGGFSYQTIWAETIRPALQKRIEECEVWQCAHKFWPRPDRVLERRMWEDKIVGDETPSPGAAAVDWREEANANV